MDQAIAASNWVSNAITSCVSLSRRSAPKVEVGPESARVRADASGVRACFRSALLYPTVRENHQFLRNCLPAAIRHPAPGSLFDRLSALPVPLRQDDRHQVVDRAGRCAERARDEALEPARRNGLAVAGAGGF